MGIYKENQDVSQDAYHKARKRVDQLKGFYWHFFWYLAVNIFITVSKISSDLSEGKTFSDAFFEFPTFSVWTFWGIGIAFHAIGVFGRNIVFGKNWEDKKVQEYMEKEKKQNWE